jgi:hypothetical protein
VADTEQWQPFRHNLVAQVEEGNFDFRFLGFQELGDGIQERALLFSSLRAAALTIVNFRCTSNTGLDTQNGTRSMILNKVTLLAPPPHW